MSERVQDYVVDYSVTSWRKPPGHSDVLAKRMKTLRNRKKAVPEFPNSFF